MSVVIHESAYVDEPSDLGEGTKIWHFSHIMKGARMVRVHDVAPIRDVVKMIEAIRNESLNSQA